MLRELRTRLFTLLLPLLVAALLITPPAHAEDAEPEGEELISIGSVIVETFTPEFKKLVSTQHYGPETEGAALEDDEIGMTPAGTKNKITTMASGTGGTSSASGCRKVWVNNRASTVTGSTAYWFKTWTSWCWTRSTQTVRDVATGWRIEDVDPQQYWRGIINQELYFYDFSTDDGHPRSAYLHYRQGMFENCVLKYGCIRTSYPANTLRSYYNGTWAWRTDG